jgi:hypothetical protein
MLGMGRITVTVHSFNMAELRRDKMHCHRNRVIGNHLFGACFIPTPLGDGRAHADGLWTSQAASSGRQRVDSFDAAQPAPPSHWPDFQITEFVHSYFWEHEFVLELFIAPLRTRISIMAEVSKTPQLKRAAAQAAARVAPQERGSATSDLGTADDRLSIAHITGVEQLMAPRVRK